MTWQWTHIEQSMTRRAIDVTFDELPACIGSGTLLCGFFNLPFLCWAGRDAVMMQQCRAWCCNDAMMCRPAERGGRGGKCPGARRLLGARQGPQSTLSIWDTRGPYIRGPYMRGPVTALPRGPDFHSVALMMWCRISDTVIMSDVY